MTTQNQSVSRHRQDAGLPDLTPAEMQKGMRFVYYAAALGVVYFFATNGNILTLFLKRLGAGNVQIGIVFSLLQAAAVIQIFIAGKIERHGKKPFIIGGWLVATTISLAYLAVPAAAARYGSTRAVYILMALVIPVALARQVAMPGWMPLVHDVVPAEIRGRFIGKMRTVWQATCIVFLVFAALFFAGAASAPFWRYQVVIAIGILASYLRIISISRIPQLPPVPHEHAHSLWRTVKVPFADSDYVRYTLFSVLLGAALATSDSYTVVYLKSSPLNYDDSHALFTSTVVFLSGSALALVFWGILADKVGSRPLLIINTLGMGLVRFLWLGATSPALGSFLVPAFYFLNGIFFAGYGIANTKYLFSISPKHFGKTTYIVMANVIVTLVSAALIPMGGFIIDGLSGFHAALGAWGLDEYRLPFLASGVMILASAPVLAGFREHGAVPTRKVILRIVSRPVQSLYGLFLLARPLMQWFDDTDTNLADENGDDDRAGPPRK